MFAPFQNVVIAQNVPSDPNIETPKREAQVIVPVLEEKNIPTGSARMHLLSASLEYEAEQSRRTRIMGGIGGVTAGALTLGLGLAAKYSWNEDWGVPVAIVGGVVMATSVIPFFVPSKMESIRNELVAQRGKGSDDALALRIEDKWEKAAKEEYTWRHVGGYISMGLAPVLVGLGIWELSSDTTFDSLTEQRILGYTTVALGVGSLIGGVSALLIEGPIERGYKTYQGSRNAAFASLATPLSFGFAPRPSGGGAVTFAGTF